MYAGFNLRIDEYDDIFGNFYDYERLVREGRYHLDTQKAKYSKELKEYVTKDIIDGTRVQNEWFPQIEADVFISHSHNDEDLACALAGWIHETFRLRCFLDSNVWGYSGELLEIMNDKLSDKRRNGASGYLYDHQSCNQVSQHVNAMLSIALQKMIDRVEAVILLNTENSIRVCTDDHMENTYSPWIYSEIACTQIVRKKPLLVYRDYLLNTQREDVLLESTRFVMHLAISYTVSLAHLIYLNTDDLQKWEKRYSSGNYKYALDALYEFHCREDLENTKELFNALDEQELRTLRSAYSIQGANPETKRNAEEVWMRVINRGRTCCQK